MNQEDVGYQRTGQWGGGPKSGLNTSVKALWVKSFWRKALCGNALCGKALCGKALCRKALWRKSQWVSSYKRVFCSTVCIPVWLVFQLKGVPHPRKVQSNTKCRIWWRASDAVLDTWWVGALQEVARQDQCLRAVLKISSYIDIKESRGRHIFARSALPCVSKLLVCEFCSLFV